MTRVQWPASLVLTSNGLRRRLGVVGRQRAFALGSGCELLLHRPHFMRQDLSYHGSPLLPGPGHRLSEPFPSPALGPQDLDGPGLDLGLHPLRGPKLVCVRKSVEGQYVQLLILRNNPQLTVIFSG